MSEYKPSYPILSLSQMEPRGEIRLVPDWRLDSLTLAEISNIKAGIPYKFTIADTPSNRENFNLKASYIQMVAYKEGWEFKPENLEVVYLPPNNQAFDNGEARVWEFKEGAANKVVPIGRSLRRLHRVSSKCRLGFHLCGDKVRQMNPSEADDLGEKVIQLFGDVED